MSDYISRHAAIDALGWGNEWEVMDFTVIDKDDAIHQIKALPSAQQWIPCSERPPEKSGDYLVTVVHHSGELWVEVDQFDNTNGSWWHYMDDVIAWMPLPEPYKGEET